jgi:hypothetical protein
LLCWPSEMYLECITHTRASVIKSSVLKCQLTDHQGARRD